MAEGVKRASEKLGKGSEQFAMHIKGLELPGYDIRGLKTTALGLAIAQIKLANMKRAGVDCMVVTCPYCMIQYDLIQRAFNQVYNIPVFYYPELLCLAMGEKPEN